MRTIAMIRAGLAWEAEQRAAGARRFAEYERQDAEFAARIGLRLPDDRFEDVAICEER